MFYFAYHYVYFVYVIWKDGQAELTWETGYVKRYRHDI